MFDISDYYSSAEAEIKTEKAVPDIENEISGDIEYLIKNRFENLYEYDRFKKASGLIEIITPKIFYGGKRSFVPNGDKIKSLLSLYPAKEDLEKIDKIVFRPKNIRTDSVELTGLYLRKKRILVMYLAYPHSYSLKAAGENLMETIIRETSAVSPSPSFSVSQIPPLWYYISQSGTSDSDTIDKFFLRTKAADVKIRPLIDDISFYYIRHGY